LIGEPRDFGQHFGIIDIDCGGRYRNISILYGRFEKNAFQPAIFLHRPNATSLRQGNFTSFITDNPHGTAIVINIGAHLGTDTTRNGLDLFHEAVALLFKWIDNTARPGKDIVFVRSTVVGHPQCEPSFVATEKDYRKGFQIKPLASYAEWESLFRKQMRMEENSMYVHHGWEYFEYFNDYTKAVLKNFTAHHVHWVNVWNMTVLRRDGHNGANAIFHDCLHYHNPGPVDWWVHIWYSQLVELASIVYTAN